jgi:hypothetical protein
LPTRHRWSSTRCARSTNSPEPNGAGKTSTLRCIAGIHRPTRRTVTIGSHDIVRDPVAAKRSLAYVADEPHLFEHLTVMEHLRLMGRIYGVGAADVRGRELLGELELADREHTLPSELSRGLVFALVAPAAAGAAVWFALGGEFSWGRLLLRTVVFTLVLLVECLVSTELLGRVFERADLQDVAVSE